MQNTIHVLHVCMNVHVSILVECQRKLNKWWLTIITCIIMCSTTGALLDFDGAEPGTTNEESENLRS